jgi:hypothetical protein
MTLNLKSLSIKYADSLPEDIQEAKSAIVNCFELYVSENSKNPVLAILAGAGEKNCKKFISDYNKLLKLIEKPSYFIIFEHLNEMVTDLFEMKKSVRETIDDIYKIKRQSDVNARAHLKSKFEMIRDRVFSILKKQAKIYEKWIVGDEKNVEEKTRLNRNEVKVQPKELSKDTLLRFRLLPYSEKFGLGSEEIMERILFYPDLRRMVEHIINSISRGHDPRGDEIKEETLAIKQNLKLKLTNESSLEGKIYDPQQMESLINEDAVKKYKQRQSLKPDPQFLLNQEISKKEDQNWRQNKMKELEEEGNERQEELNKEESKLLSKYNNLTLREFLK